MDKIAYEAYYEATGGRNPDDKELPTWDNLPVDEQKAWWAVAKAVVLSEHKKNYTTQ